jgi:hypothetical protein
MTSLECAGSIVRPEQAHDTFKTRLLAPSVATPLSEAWRVSQAQAHEMRRTYEIRILSVRRPSSKLGLGAATRCRCRRKEVRASGARKVELSKPRRAILKSTEYIEQKHQDIESFFKASSV